MTKPNLVRLVALLLIPCFVVEPSMTQTFSQQTSDFENTNDKFFVEQAIVPQLVEAFHQPVDRIAARLARLVSPFALEQKGFFELELPEFSFSGWTGSGFDMPVPQTRRSIRIPLYHFR